MAIFQPQVKDKNPGLFVRPPVISPKDPAYPREPQEPFPQPPLSAKPLAPARGASTDKFGEFLQTASAVIDVAQAGVELYDGYKTSQLESQLYGAETNVGSVSGEDVYGAYGEYQPFTADLLPGEGEPIRLAEETSLTRIANARAAGRLTTQEANTRASMIIKQMANENPRYAEDIVKMGQRFFNNGGTRGTSSGGGNWFAPTEQEKLEQKIYEQRVMATDKFNTEAALLNRTPQEHREMLSFEANAKFAATRLAEEQNQEYSAVRMDVTQVQGAYSLSFIGEIKAALDKNGGMAIDAVDSRNLIQNMNMKAAMLMDSIRTNRPNMSDEQFRVLINDVTAWRDEQINLVEQGNLQEFVDSVSKEQMSVANAALTLSNPALMHAFANGFGSEFLAMLTMTDEQKEAMGNFSSIFKQLEQNSDTVASLNWRAKQSQTALSWLFTGEAPAATGGVEVDPDAVAALTQQQSSKWIMGGMIGVPEEAANRAFEVVKAMAKESARPLEFYTSTAGRAQINNNPAYQQAAIESFKNAVGMYQRNTARGLYDVNMLTIRESTDKGIPGHIYEHAFLSQLFRPTYEHNTLVEVNKDALNEEIRRSRDAGMRDVEATRHREAARELQYMFNFAEIYPNLEIDGMPINTYLQTQVLGLPAEPWSNEGGSEEPGGAPAPFEEPQSSAGPGPVARAVEAVVPAAQAGFGDTMIGPGSIADQTRQAEQLSSGAANSVYRHLARREGSGDTLTDVPTGNMGVTEAARKAVKASKDTPDHEVAAAYLELLESKFAKNMPGFEDAPEQAKAMLLDAGYNMGEQVTRFSGVKAAMERGDYREAGLNLLDTANVDGQTVRGVALRRAESFNLLGEEQIAFVEQLPDGTIKYLDESDNVIFQYKTPKGRHPKSAAIKSPVMTENRLLAMNEGSNLFVKALEMFAQ